MRLTLWLSILSGAAGLACVAMGLHNRGQRLVAEMTLVCGSNPCGDPPELRTIGPGYLGWLIAGSIILALALAALVAVALRRRWTRRPSASFEPSDAPII